MVREVRSETNNRAVETTKDVAVPVRFDYGSVSASVAKFLRGQADRIRRQCVTSIIQIGRALIEAKRHLSHGEFLSWVECEVGIPARTAQAYMRVASWASNKGATVAHLSPSALYLLSASTTPEEFVVQILSRAEAGEYIAPSVIREELKVRREQEDEPRQPPSSDQTLHSDPRRRATASSEGAEEALNEFVSMLADRLSASDFARARDIVTSPSVLSDPELPRKLGLAFECIDPASVDLV